MCLHWVHGPHNADTDCKPGDYNKRKKVCGPTRASFITFSLSFAKDVMLASKQKGVMLIHLHTNFPFVPSSVLALAHFPKYIYICIPAEYQP